jgi:hypothetical protein
MIAGTNTITITLSSGRFASPLVLQAASPSDLNNWQVRAGQNHAALGGVQELPDRVSDTVVTVKTGNITAAAGLAGHTVFIPAANLTRPPPPM